MLQQVRENEERFELKAERTLHYKDGSTRQFGVASVGAQPQRARLSSSRPRKRAPGRTARTWSSSGDVRVEASDGFALEADSATYNKDQHIVRAPGDVAFTKGRLKGSATGMSYDTNTEMLSLLAKPDVRFEPGETDEAKADAVPGGLGDARQGAAPAVAREAGDRGPEGPDNGVRTASWPGCRRTSSA